MALQNRLDRQASQRRARLRKRQPSLELCEQRLLMASGAGFIQGFVLDNTNNPISSATVELWDNTGNRQSGDLLATSTTDSSGYYNFDSYALVAGTTYQITESATGYSASVGSGDIQTTIDPACAIDGGTAIRVTAENLSTQSIGVTWTGDSYTLAYPTVLFNSTLQTPNSRTFGTDAGSLTFVTGNAGTTSDIESFCSDLVDTIYGPPSGAFLVEPGLTSDSTSLTSNIGEIGYLYNTFGTSPQGGSPGNDESINGAGLQLAIWALEYNQTGNLNDTNFAVEPPTASSIIAAANAYLADAAGHSQDVYFLNVTEFGSTGGQGMLSTDLLDFTNTAVVVPASPTISTNAGGTVVLGSGGDLTDSATLSGGNNPTGTITFTLTGQGARWWIPRRCRSPATAPTRLRPATCRRGQEATCGRRATAATATIILPRTTGKTNRRR